MGLWADIGDQCNRGSMKECESNSLKDPHDQKRPKRGSEKIGNRSEGIKEGADDHKGFFRNCQKRSSNIGSKDQ